MQCEIEYLSPKSPLTAEIIVELVSMHPDDVFFLDAEKLISEMQVRIAVEEASTLIGKGIGLRRKASILMLLLSGKRQIKDAIAEVGISSKTKHVLCVSLEGHLDIEKGLFKKDSFRLAKDDPARDRETFFRISSGEFFAFQ